MPVLPRTKILMKPPPDCETNEYILWKLIKQLYGLRGSPQKFQHHLSIILHYDQINVCIMTTTSRSWSTLTTP
eukprot:4047958-Amphidinium_carterae.4